MSVAIYRAVVLLTALPYIIAFQAAIRTDKVGGTLVDDTDVMLNDDFIIPKPNLACSEDDQPDCSSDVHSNHARDAIIYPVAKISTKATTKRPTTQSTRPRHAGTRTATTSQVAAKPTTTTVSVETRDPPLCQQTDDEDCIHGSGGGGGGGGVGGGGGGAGGGSGPDLGVERLSPPDRKKSPGGEGSASGKDRTKTKHPPKTDEGRTGLRPADAATLATTSTVTENLVDGGSEVVEGEEEEEREVNGGRYAGSTARISPVRGSPDGGSGGGDVAKDPNRLAMHTNIILIIGIATGLVILLIILIIAVCKYYGRGTGAAAKADYVYKGDRGAGGAGSGGMKGYAYEACNTVPPRSTVPMLPPDLAPNTASLSYSGSAAPMTFLQGGGGVGGMGGASLSAATLPPVKPAKKDVKEWYV